MTLLLTKMLLSLLLKLWAMSLFTRLIQRRIFLQVQRTFFVFQCISTKKIWLEEHSLNSSQYVKFQYKSLETGPNAVVRKDKVFMGFSTFYYSVSLLQNSSHFLTNFFGNFLIFFFFWQFVLVFYNFQLPRR